MICSNMADYSKISGERILPFKFTLNTEKSILIPEPGENQRFCYNVEGVGEDSPMFADLSHFLLGICKDITVEDLISVTVVVDGVPQEINLGENVQIKTEEKPDPPTGCAGLKFDFGLDKEEGEMEVCFTLARTFAVGPVNVCIFGGNVTAAGLSVCGPVCGETPAWDTVFFQKENICVPVTLTPFATPGEATVRCSSRPVVRPGAACPNGERSCTFTVTQQLCIEIPIRFGADVKTGPASVQCGDVTETPCDCEADADISGRRMGNLMDTIGRRKR